MGFQIGVGKEKGSPILGCLKEFRGGGRKCSNEGENRGGREKWRRPLKNERSGSRKKSQRNKSARN